MKFTNEQLLKAKAAKSAEELLALAKENGMEMTDDEAKKYFSDLHKEGELSDDELDNVSGGCGGDPTPKYHVGDQFHNEETKNDYKIQREGYWNESAGTFEYDILGKSYGPQGDFTFSITKLETELDVLPRIYD